MAFKKGNIPYNLGIKHTQEHINKIRIAAKNNPNYGMKGKHHSIISKVKISNKNLGKKHSEEAKRKMSLARKNKKHSTEHNQNVSIALKRYKKTDSHIANIKKATAYRKGKTYEELFGIEKAEMIKSKFNRTLQNNSNWLGGKSFEPYGLEFNKWFKQKIKIRDNCCCIICGSLSNISIHHIDYNKLNNNERNCISLCCSCHSKTNFNRTHWIEFFNSYLREKRYIENEELFK